MREGRSVRDPVAAGGRSHADGPASGLWGAFIGGGWVQAGDRDTFAVIEPATGREIAAGQRRAQLVDRAVAADSRRAFGGGGTRRPVSAAG